MQVLIVCNVIDNYGDAGVSLRLARELCRIGHHVLLLHNNADTFANLLQHEVIPNFQLIYAEFAHTSMNDDFIPDLVLEPFGSSNDENNCLVDTIQQKFPKAPWLIVDYLSAEGWTHSFHLTLSINPKTGHRSTYFYPGFGPKTGGIIHADFPTESLPATNKTTNIRKIFVFCYNITLIEQLGQALDCQQQLATPHDTKNLQKGKTPFMQLDFCAQKDFDQRLLEYDFLFVRGEDSFIRAQLAGKPFVWQTYPTPDQAHRAKLDAFFALYAQQLSQHCADSLYALWLNWNGFLNLVPIEQTWKAVIPHYVELAEHAQNWQSTLLNGPELVREILTWGIAQSVK